MRLGKYESLHLHHSEISSQIEFLFVLGNPKTFEAVNMPDFIWERVDKKDGWRFIDQILQNLRFRAYRRAGFFLDHDVEFNYDAMIRMEDNGRFEC